MKKPKKRWSVAILILAATIGVGAATRELNLWTQLPLEAAPGGCYIGELPGFGKVQFNLFLAEPWSMAWLWREGIEDPGYGQVNTNSAGEFRFDLVSNHEDVTNATLEFGLTNAGDVLQGVVRKASNTLAQPFVLTRIYQHSRIHKHCGLVLGRLGTYASASSQLPLLSTNSPFLAALNWKLTAEAQKSVRRFTSGNFQRQWEMLRYGRPPFREGEQDDLWQVRLLTGKVGSFAVWNWCDYSGSNGNLMSWRGRNFWWHGGSLCELKLPDLFLPGVDWKSQIRQLCCDELQRQEYTSESRSVLNEDIGFDEFTISATGLQIYFNPYSLSSGANGEYIMHIPYKLLRTYLRPDLLAVMAPPDVLK